MRALAVLNVAIKVALVAAIVFMFTHPDLPQFENKSLTLRAVLYPLFSLMVAAGYYLKGMRGDYPHLLDILWSFTFTFDIVSNDAHLYGSYANYDDLIHFINALPFMFVLVGLLLSLERLNRFRLGYGGIILVALTAFIAFHAIWEMYEHSMDRFLGTNLQPGGMVEATDNNFFAIVGALLAVAILYYWRKARSFEVCLLSPTSGYLGQLLVRQGARSQIEPPGRAQASEEFQIADQDR
ncbi:MAG: hypothetical protein Q8P22_14470 [Chloroflexota bacterium]|nr:hypothetical protein [Chloroflexota bacterium]